MCWQFLNDIIILGLSYRNPNLLPELQAHENVFRKKVLPQINHVQQSLESLQTEANHSRFKFQLYII